MTAALTKVLTDGTHRVRRAEETWDAVAPLLYRFGITRVADITRLDTIGIPVMMAVRPLARTLSVSQGKGQTPLLAKVSAVMEAIELWHAEFARVPVTIRGASADELDLPYRVTELAMVPGSLVNSSSRLDWVSGTGITTGRRTVVPAETVHLSGSSEASWVPPGLGRTSNGLASGNVREEAILHALYEVIERDATSRCAPADRRVVSEEVPGTGELVEKVRAAGARLQVFHIPSRFDVPVFAAQIWSEDFPVSSIGAGAHLATDVALSRAVTEAAQSRLTGIAGSRDDLPALYRQVRDGGDDPPPRPASSPATLRLPEVPSFDDLSAELAYLAGKVRSVLGTEGIVVDLGTCDEFSVVRVVVPCADFHLARLHAGD